jgi:hypothetical protein
MSTDGKVKFYKNPARSQVETHTPYVPQYKSIMPELNNTSLPPVAQIISKPSQLPNDNPRAARVLVRQPYAETVTSPIGRGKGPVPNVGNNMEHTWSSVDGAIVDDISEFDVNQPIIDNNDFVSEEALGLSDSIVEIDEDTVYEKPTKTFLSTNDLKDAIHENDMYSALQSLDAGDYILLVSGVVLCSGQLLDIQQQVRDLVFGEHQLYNGNTISIDDIVVLKRINIKVGIFLE